MTTAATATLVKAATGVRLKLDRRRAHALTSLRLIAEHPFMSWLGIATMVAAATARPVPGRGTDIGWQSRSTRSFGVGGAARTSQHAAGRLPSAFATSQLTAS